MWTQRIAASATLAVLVGAGAACSTSGETLDPGLEGLEVTAVNPEVIIPGSRIVIEGRSFVSETWGSARLRMSGTFNGSDVDVTRAATFVDFNRMEITADGGLIDDFGDTDGEFTGDVIIEIDSAVDGETYASKPLFTRLVFARQLAPQLDSIDSGSLIFINDKISVTGDGFLLGDGEGQTVAIIDGCFTLEGGQSCVQQPMVEVPVSSAGEFDRTTASFEFSPTIAGIEAGSFVGTVTLRNQHAESGSLDSTSAAVDYDITEPVVFQVTPGSASLGQYVEITGGGFLGGDAGGLTLLELTGSFTPQGAVDPVPVDLILVPEYVEGRRVRYVLNEDDALGQAIDLRRVVGSFTGQVTPVTSYDGTEVVGSSGNFNVGIAPIKQVVFLSFKPSYVESLRHFGLRALDQTIRERIKQVVERDYDTVNVEVRLERPTDFSQYSEVEIAGPDPNGLGLLGYDNTPGKDTGNERLYDRIGGVNATTQEDGYPGFGGVFIESLFAFSKHPGGYADSISSADGTFDDIFDPFRPDRGGLQVTAADLGSGAVLPTNGDSCPAEGRASQVECATWVLGSLIGTTLSHEIGHSLGLANPFGEGFHNSSDEVNRLMDSGGDRPFAERAELFGQGPAKFCITEYEYLRQILPTSASDDSAGRPTCF